MKSFGHLIYLASLALIGGIALSENRTITRYRQELELHSKSAMRLEREALAWRDLSPLGPKPAADGDAFSPETPLRDDASGPVDSVVVSEWLKKVKQLRQAFADQPAQRIPQLALLSDREWVAVAREANFETADDIDRALANARTAAKSRFVGQLYSAMERYLSANQGSLPSDLNDLLPYLGILGNDPNSGGGASASDPAMLAQYELKASGKLKDAPEGPLVEERALLNEDLDHRIELEHTKDGLVLSESSTSVTTSDGGVDDASFERSVRAFAAAHNGVAPDSPADLIPFLDGPLAGIIKESIAEHPATPEGVRAFKTGVARLLSKPASP